MKKSSGGPYWTFGMAKTKNKAGDEHGETTFGIKVDRAREGDEALEAEGVTLFVNPASAIQAAGHKLNYVDESGFVLRWHCQKQKLVTGSN